MPKIKYEEWNPKEETIAVVHQANQIIESYAADGYDLTLRQLYYQFVSRDLIANKQSEYKRLGDIISKARRAGLVDWRAIVDRTRNLQALSHWENPSQIVEAVAQQFRLNLWKGQEHYVEVWFEKDALMGVFERAANPLRMPFFSCRGYTSDSEVWSAAQRLKLYAKNGKNVVVLHFGDHDPSGLDMTRDIRERLALFGARAVDVRRLALNMDQVRRYEPPPNPAKEVDPRFAGYQAEYGDESWELDALEPRILARLVKSEVEDLIDVTSWDDQREKEALARAELTAISEQYPTITRTFCKGAADAMTEHLDEDSQLFTTTEEDEDAEE